MLKIEKLSFSYGNEQILEDFSLTLPKNGVFAIMGPSGCGKSTLFALISGLLKPSSGNIRLETERLAFDFQDARLIPWMSAAENVNFVLGGKKTTLAKAKKALAHVGLEAASDKYPNELSGGMQKRVSLARAFVCESDFILLDEPFAGLDSETKSGIIEKIKQIGKNSLVLLITHDIGEANDCAEKIFDFKQLNKKNTANDMHLKS